MNMCPTNKCKPPPELCLKGQVFFIYTNIQSLESVKDRISLLGGKVDPFLSRDVTAVLVEDNHLVGSQLLSPDLTIKSAYGSNAAVVTSFPYSNSLYSIPSTSRGYNFIATNTSNSPYRVICYALQWGISVYGIGQFLTWIEPQVKTATTRQKKKASENVSNLNGFYIKFESLLKNYRPCYKMFNNDPSHLLPLKNANIFVKTEACNVILDKPVGSRQLHFTHMDTTDRTTHQGKGANFPVKANDKKPPNKVKPKEESNYCECCRVHFSDLKQHIKSSRHQSFVSNEKNYESVHNILKMLPTPQEFIEKLQNPSPSADSVIANGDKSLAIQTANMPETDYSVPLNLQMRKETTPAFTMPLDLYVEKTNVISVAPSLIKEETAPLDLHVKKKYEVNIETKDKQETNLLVDFQQVDSYKKEDSNNIQSKIEIQKESVVESININDKQPIETPNEIQCDELNGDSLLDRTNTAALAQLCLKNFDSYWLDTIPCEVDDMVFDDIFDIDDGKGKLDNECLEPFDENFAAPDIAQTAGLVSINSTPNIKLETNEDQPVLTSNILDVKDNTEVYNSQSIMPSKLEKDCEASLSPRNASSYHGSVLQGKKQIFSIASFCSDKVSIEATPSCSNAVPPSKQQELLFSSESSDDENGNVLISNALNMITNSDSEAKVDKESSEENSIQEQSGQKYIPVTSCSVSEVKSDKIFSDNATKDNEILDQMNSVHEKNENSSLVQNPANEIKMDIDNCKENEIQPVVTEERKIDIQSLEKNIKISDLASKDAKTTSIFNKECYVSRRKSSTSDINSEMSVDNLVPSKRICSEEVNVCKLNLPTDNEILSGKVKTDPDSYKENTTERKMREISSNEIYKQNSTPVNGIIDDAKQIKVSYAEMPVSIQNFCTNEPVNLDTKDRYLIPKKKASFYELKKRQISSESNFAAPKVVPCENKVDQTSYFTSVNTFVRKDEKPPERIKDHPVLVEKCYVNKRNIKKDVFKEEYPTYSANPCQYSYKNDKCDANISSNALPVQSSVSELSVKIPHKKKSSKLRKLPPLWSVSVLPGNGVKLKFTCLHPNKKDTLHSENRG